MNRRQAELIKHFKNDSTSYNVLKWIKIVDFFFIVFFRIKNKKKETKMKIKHELQFKNKLLKLSNNLVNNWSIKSYKYLRLK